ncbi:MAG: bifunctional phosphopantothenoylcysteine decarboxylase/phosphopantothenate--cysteine ligase CoaBC [Oligoflexia bacterium]|nr:bifunctional phosphopantothenoylcysteine decarboxylase/phosphopantothenate--cysteine ligase CoaBC [Oligoflexia bacterium]
MKLLLGVSGSISAYKAYDLTRLFVKAGHEIKVVMTGGAAQFIKKETFLYLGASAVYSSQDDFNVNDYQGIPHIELAKWADKLLVAPLSANTLGKFAGGLADDLLSSIFLAWEKTKPIILFPAMNTKMLSNPITQDNFKKLETLLPNIFIHPTQSGLLACGDEGEGKLSEIETIFHFTESFVLVRKEKEFLVTTGATLSPLDPVRYITNASSGKTGFLMAKVALSLGYKVTVIAGIYATSDLERLSAHPDYKLVRTISTENMANAVKEEIARADVYFSSAAVSDIEFEYQESKMKKEQMSGTLAFQQAIDILSGVIKLTDKKRFIIGFAAETNLDEQMLKSKNNRKPVDLLIGTQVNNGLLGKSKEGFGNDFATYKCLLNNEYIEWLQLTKQEMCEKCIAIYESTNESIDQNEERIH